MATSTIARVADRFKRILQSRLTPDSSAIVIIGAVTATAIWRFWQAGVVGRADMMTAIYRVFVLDQSWHTQAWYPRIANGINFGYSGPLFEYYPPLASYLALAGHWAGLDWIASTKAAFSWALMVAGLGMYLYARWLFHSPRAALLSALTYVLAPYILLNIYERAALAECLALALLPWLFWSGHHLLQAPTRGWFCALTGLTALIMLAHNITTLFVLPLLAFYLLGLAWLEHRWRSLPVLSLALACGLGLSAFYWIPAIAETGYSKLAQQMAEGRFYAANNLIAPQNLVQLKWDFDYWHGDRFRLALSTALLAGLALLGVWSLPRLLSRRLMLILTMLAGCLLLMLTVSRDFWRVLPLVRFIQFPWRLLGFVSFFVALLAGSILAWPRLRGRAGVCVAAVLIAFLAYASLRNLDPALSTHWYMVAPDEIGLQDMYERGQKGLALNDDYIPVSMAGKPADLTRSRPAGTPAPRPLPQPPAIQVLAESPYQFQLNVHAPAPFTLQLPRVSFPVWQVYMAGRPVPTRAQAPFGLVATDLPAGDYPVLAQFQETPIRLAADVLSVACLVVLAIGVFLTRSVRLLWLVGLGIIALGILLALDPQAPGQSARRPATVTATFADGIQLLGYQIDEQNLRPGDVLTFRLYWLAQQMPTSDYTIFGHLIKSDDSGAVAQADEFPNLGSSPTSRWQPGELVVDEHQIHLSHTIPRGTYRLVIGLYKAEDLRNLPVHSAAQVLPGDRLVLTDIKIADR